ncbi:hypothetical protein A3F57_06275 [Candidatus Roizmanbacteria bacterium RIFCSPHIGHO2_12_FULL_36_11]|nr:MAG: hypothetical protein A3F57_06275 [Candidatus Roizmanbacteria bacterium RIFCSPHIGHO2_12_FULL_36_11]
MTRSEARSFQYTLDSAVELETVFVFPVRKTIYTSLGRGEIIKHPITARRLEQKEQGLYIFQALTPVDIYVFKFHGERKLNPGSYFTAYSSQGRKIKV